MASTSACSVSNLSLSFVDVVMDSWTFCSRALSAASYFSQLASIVAILLELMISIRLFSKVSTVLFTLAVTKDAISSWALVSECRWVTNPGSFFVSHSLRVEGVDGLSELKEFVLVTTCVTNGVCYRLANRRAVKHDNSEQHKWKENIRSKTGNLLPFVSLKSHANRLKVCPRPFIYTSVRVFHIYAVHFCVPKFRTNNCPLVIASMLHTRRLIG